MTSHRVIAENNFAILDNASSCGLVLYRVQRRLYTPTKDNTLTHRTGEVSHPCFAARFLCDEEFHNYISGPLMLRYSFFKIFPQHLSTGFILGLWVMTSTAIAQYGEVLVPDDGEMAVSEQSELSLEGPRVIKVSASSKALPTDPDNAPESTILPPEQAATIPDAPDLNQWPQVNAPAQATNSTGELPSASTDRQQLDNDIEQLDGDAQKLPQSLNILGSLISPGESRRLLWIASETSYGSKLETPVYIIHGKEPGPTLCLTAAIHGDELNGVEIVRQLVSDLSADDLYGTVIGVPIVNLLGFTRGSRYLPDRRDLNRFFPGNPYGSSASRIAFSFFQDIVRHCDLLIDVHTGSLNRTNLAQVRANLQIPEVLELTTKFGSTAVLHSRKLSGNLRSAATKQGIPAVALELGEPGSLQKAHIKEGVEIIETVMIGLDMIRRLWTIGESQPVFYRSRWVRVNYGGLLVSKVEVGERIREGDDLGTIVNPLTNESFKIVSPYSGRILGMALNQFMLPGYAAFNVGIVADEETAAVDAPTSECVFTPGDPKQVSEEFGCTSDENEEFERFDLEEIDEEAEGDA